MANWINAGRSTSAMMRAAATWRATVATTRLKSSSRISVSPLSSSHRPNLKLCCHSRVSPLHSSRLVRRELSSLVPLHCAIAWACLVSKVPSEASTSTEGRFANYISPI